MLNVLAALLLLATGSAPVDDRGPPIVLKDATVVSAIEAGIDSGMIAFWNRIDARTARGEAKTLFQIHMTRGEPALPPVGAICDFTYRMGQLGGSMGSGLNTDTDWAQIDSFICRK